MNDHDDDPSPVLAQAEELRDLLQGRHPYDLLGPTSVVQFARSMVADLVDLIAEEEREDDLDDTTTARLATEEAFAHGTATWADVLRAWDREELDACPVLPPIATDEQGRIIPMSDAEWAVRSEAFSRALKAAAPGPSVPRCLGGVKAAEIGFDLIGDGTEPEL